ncbi:uncharacterized protein LOC121286011 [Carcharodon carcharias]|uniref:uncharacterized protein LOC121286011 n=1 Tax=Carcharodon carcharias TaxID=13397 RepID=UPI001B7EE439|nr:uncharacterized protein LOC121286011 [Carcharodon carcharias]
MMELYSTDHSRLDEFIKNNLEPNEFNTTVKNAVHRICEFLRNRCFLKQPEIKVIRAVKGGSSGKGTALRNGSDADLVVFLSCFQSFQDQRNTRLEILEGIQQMLEKCESSIAYEISDININFIPNSNIPPKSMSFSIKSRKKNSDRVDFDILPTFDALKGTDNASEAYLKLINLVNEKRALDGEFSSCFTELQRKFVKQCKPKLKDLIRLLKYWYKQHVKPRKSALRDGERLPAKYTVELLAIYAWEQGNEQERFSTAEGFRTVLELICRYQDLCIYWTQNYNVNNRVIADFLIKKLCGKRPIILDPADPTGNVAVSTGWHVMVDEAMKCLRMPCVSPVLAWDVQPIKEFEITVFTLDGSSLSLNANINNTISMIKKEIQQKWDIPIYQQRLSFNEAILGDNKSLLHSGIFFDATLHLVITTSMQIFVRTVNGRDLTLDVSPTDKVLSLRNKIESLERLSSSQYYLTYGSIPLEDGNTLESYGIEQHSTININLRLRGGKETFPASAVVALVERCGKFVNSFQKCEEEAALGHCLQEMMRELEEKKDEEANIGSTETVNGLQFMMKSNDPKILQGFFQSPMGDLFPYLKISTSLPVTVLNRSEIGKVKWRKVLEANQDEDAKNWSLNVTALLPANCFEQTRAVVTPTSLCVKAGIMELYSTDHRRLDDFIKNNLEPSEFNINVRNAVHRICEFLRNRCFLKQHEIKVIRAVKGGSSGKGTALRKCSDADLVVFLSCFQSFQDQRITRREILEGIQQMLEKCALSIAYEISDISINFIPNSNIPPKSMSFSIKSRKKNSDSVDFDILPTFDALKGTDNASEAHLKLINLVTENRAEDGEFSSCFTELQRKFVKQCKPKLKDLIRLLKYWYKQHVKPRKSALRDGERLPAKYTVELLAIYAWEQGNGQERFSTAEGFRTVLELICRYQDLCIYWTQNYNVNNRVIADFLIKKLCGKRPIILDPADPTGNVAVSTGWYVMVDEAMKCLSKPCVSQVRAWDVQPIKEFEITVFTLDGSSLSLNANINNTISMIKKEIQQKWDIPVYQQRLSFNEAILGDNKSLLHSGIFFDATLHLVITTSMQIFVRTVNGRDLTLDVSPTDKVLSLRNKIESLERLSSSQYYLTYGSIPLEDGNTLESYGIKQHSTININLRLRGGKETLYCSSSGALARKQQKYRLRVLRWLMLESRWLHSTKVMELHSATQPASWLAMNLGLSESFHITYVLISRLNFFNVLPVNEFWNCHINYLMVSVSEKVDSYRMRDKFGAVDQGLDHYWPKSSVESLRVLLEIGHIAFLYIIILRAKVWMEVSTSSSISSPVKNFTWSFILSKLLLRDEQDLQQFISGIEENMGVNEESCLADSDLGGSSGKGTALRKCSDADLVVFLSCFQSFQDQRNTRREILEGIQQMLEKCESSIAYEISDISINFIPDSNIPPKSMSFSIKSKKKNLDSVDFDILPIKALDGEFSSCFTELQRKFVKQFKPKLKDLIRLLKYWYKQHVKPRKSDLRDGERLHAKYTVELLVIYAWEQGNGQERFSTAEGFRTVLELICRYQDLCIYWTQNYNVKNRVIADFLIKKLRGKRPIILDPADPTRNVAASTGWYVMVDEAKKCLSKPCVSQVRAWDVQPIKEFKITVLRLFGSSTSLNVNIDNKISMIKKQIQQKWNIPVYQQRLSFNEVILDDNKSLLHSGIFFDATLHLVITIQIFVRTVNGRALTLDVSPTDKVMSLRNKIESLERLSSSQYYLTYGLIPLEDGHTLESYCIEQHSTININLRLRGGKETLYCSSSGALARKQQKYRLRVLRWLMLESRWLHSTRVMELHSARPPGSCVKGELLAAFMCSVTTNLVKNFQMMDLYEIAPKCLDVLIFHHLQPDQRFQQQVGETIDTICKFLKEKCFSGHRSVKIIKTVKGGSAGKGTALKDRSDADLVVFISQFKSFQDQKQNRGEILTVIQQMLKEFQQSIAFEIIMTEPKTSPSGFFTSPRSLNFHFKSREVSDSIEVDVLPAFDALGQQTRNRPDSQVYVDLINANGIGGEFSTCFTELQRNFVKWRPVKLKGLIRLVKHWYKVYVRPYKQQLRRGEFLPPKYALELLIIYAWETMGGGENFNTAKGFRTIMELIVKYRELWLFWTDNYNFDNPHVGQYLKNKLREPRPMILDPADPTGNVAGSARWDLVEKEAKNCLQMNCVRNISPWDVEPVKGILVSVKPVDILCSRERFPVNPFSPIRCIKEKFEHLARIPTSSYYLEWNDQMLKENWTLSDYGIYDEVTLFLKEQSSWCILM